VLELLRSAIAFSWVSSLFAAQELVHAIAPAGQGPSCREANERFYSIIQATQEQFGDLIWAGYQIGDDLQRDLIDFVFDFLALRVFTPSYVNRLVSDALEQSQESLRVLRPGRNSRLAWQEFQNNYEVYSLVKHVRSRLRIPSGPHFPLEELIRNAYALGEFADLWAVEGLGHDYAVSFRSQDEPLRGLLTGESARVLPASSLTMMHAGIGLAFAEELMKTITPYSPVEDIDRVLQEFITLCKDNSREGYLGAAYESLGLVTRTWHAQMVSVVDRRLRENHGDVVSYFWHGSGRALYFLPMYFIPGSLSPWRALEREAPDDVGRLNMLAGLAWATTLVNMRQPEIMANLLKYRGDRLTRTDAFSNGVMSSVMMASDITPEDVYIAAFCRYRTDSSDHHLAELWESCIARPCERALNSYYPVLKKHERLGEVFHYQSYPNLIESLEGGRP